MEGRKVYVGSLNHDASKEDVEEMFQKFGKIESVWIARKPAGFAFVVFETTDAASDAVAEMNGADFKGQPLKVELSSSEGKQRQRRQEGGRYDDRRDNGVSHYGGDRRREYSDRHHEDIDRRRDDRFNDRPRYEEDRYRRDYGRPTSAPYPRRSRTRSPENRRYYDRR